MHLAKVSSWWLLSFSLEWCPWWRRRRPPPPPNPSICTTFLPFAGAKWSKSTISLTHWPLFRFSFNHIMSLNTRTHIHIYTYASNLLRNSHKFSHWSVKIPFWKGLTIALKRTPSPSPSLQPHILATASVVRISFVLWKSPSKSVPELVFRGGGVCLISWFRHYYWKRAKFLLANFIMPLLLCVVVVVDLSNTIFQFIWCLFPSTVYTVFACILLQLYVGVRSWCSRHRHRYIM